MKTPEREAKYLYADREIGSTPLVVAVRKDDTRFEYGRPQQLKGRTFGAFPEANAGEMFKAWCLEQHINANVRYFTSMEELNKAIDAGDVAGAIFGTDTTEGFRTIQLFSPQSYYAIFRKDDVELRDKVNTAMTNILAEDPLYPDKLQQKYAVRNSTKCLF
jgi:ABC-type amino acid transport substrate-binding protein